jgi:hypothetical protein
MPGDQATRDDPDLEDGSADLELTSEDLEELGRASRSVQVQGDRYPEVMQRMIDR